MRGQGLWDILSRAWFSGVNTSGKKLIDVRRNGDFWRLRPDGKTQVTTKYVLQVMAEIVEVVRLIPQERVQQRTVEQIVDVAVPQVVKEIVEVVQIIPSGASLDAYQRPNRLCASGEATPSTDHPDSSEDSGGSTTGSSLIEWQTCML